MIQNNIDVRRCNIIAMNIELGYSTIKDIPSDLNLREIALIKKLVSIKDKIIDLPSNQLNTFQPTSQKPPR